MRWEESLNVNSVILYGLGFRTKQKGESKNSLRRSTHCSLIPDSEHMVTSCLKLLVLWLSYHCGWRYLVMENQNNLFLPHSTYFGYCVIAMKKWLICQGFTLAMEMIYQSYITTPHIITQTLHVLIFLSLCSCILNGVAKITTKKTNKSPSFC